MMKHSATTIASSGGGASRTEGSAVTKRRKVAPASHSSGSSTSSSSDGGDGRVTCIMFKREDAHEEFISMPVVNIDYLDVYFKHGYFHLVVAFTRGTDQDEFHSEFDPDEFLSWCTMYGDTVLPDWYALYAHTMKKFHKQQQKDHAADDAEEDDDDEEQWNGADVIVVE